MAYDNSLDQSLFSKSFDTDAGRITVSIYSYNEGLKKIQISRENMNKSDELKFAKLGRITKSEAESIIPIMQEAIARMD